MLIVFGAILDFIGKGSWRLAVSRAFPASSREVTVALKFMRERTVVRVLGGENSVKFLGLLTQ
jgi:hypothetical protein